MLNNQIRALGEIMKNPELHTLMKDGAFNLMKCVLLHDCGSAADAARAAAALVFHTPTMLYWDKMWRYMCGVYREPADNIKMAEKFCDDNPKYEAFVKKQMNMINEFNDDQKIDYFACLTRSYLYTGLQEDLYLKLARFLTECTPGELKFLANTNFSAQLDNTMMTASLYQYGLLMLKEGADGLSKYALSDFGKSLKQNSLNFDEGLSGQTRLSSYEVMSPAALPQHITNADIDRMIEANGAGFGIDSAQKRETLNSLVDMIRFGEDGRVEVFAPPKRNS